MFVSDLASSAQQTSKYLMHFVICVISDKLETEFTLWAMFPLMWVESNVSSDCGRSKSDAFREERSDSPYLAKDFVYIPVVLGHTFDEVVKLLDEILDLLTHINERASWFTSSQQR